MFRYALTHSIGEIQNHEGVDVHNPMKLFTPSNSIIPLSFAPIIFENSIFLCQWGLPNSDQTLVLSTTLEDVLNHPDKYRNCLIPLNGYFVSTQNIHLKRCFFNQVNDTLIFSAGVLLDDDTFLFVNIPQYHVEVSQMIDLPLILSDEKKSLWLSGELDSNVESVVLDNRLVSRLALNNSFYNGKRCTEEYQPFQLHTKTMALAQEEYNKAFPEDPDWFDQA